MTKIIKITKHKMDIGKIELTKPMLLIGRSPLCDQVLRASGIKPVHFMLEWVGEGEFNPNVGTWSLFDLSDFIGNVDSDSLMNNSISLEGKLINDGLQYFDLNWQIVEDNLASSNLKHGSLSKQIFKNIKGTRKNKGQNDQAIEILKFGKNEQKVNRIWFIFDRIVSSFNEEVGIPFNILWLSNNSLEINYNQKPKAIFEVRGERLNLEAAKVLHPGNTYLLHYADDVFFLRFTERVSFIPEARTLFSNNFFLSFVLTMLFFLGVVRGIKYLPESETLNNNLTPVRVVDIVETTVVPPVEEKKPEIVKEKIVLPKEAFLEKESESKKIPQPIKTDIILNKNQNKISAAQAPSFKLNQGKQRVGLNNPAESANVNSIGLLGKVNNELKAGKVKHISAESISQTFVDNVASGSDKKGVIIQTNEMGVVGVPDKNTGGGGTSQSASNVLAQAKTTLQGTGDFNPENSGPLARVNGVKGAYTFGTGNGTAPTNSGGASSVSSTPSDGIEVKGGLTKAQVYAVIYAHRREIRTCFESALLIQNNLSGILRLNFVINVAGSVNEVKVVNSELNSDILVSCVTQVIRKMVFPEAPNQLSTTVIYPFVFKRTS